MATTLPPIWSALAAPVAVAIADVVDEPPTAPASVDDALARVVVTLMADVAVTRVLLDPVGYGAAELTMTTGVVLYAVGAAEVDGTTATDEVET